MAGRIAVVFISYCIRVKRWLPEVVAARMKAKGMPDAHLPEHVGRDFKATLNLLRNVGYTEISWFKKRRRKTTDLSTARQKLNLTK